MLDNINIRNHNLSENKMKAVSHIAIMKNSNHLVPKVANIDLVLLRESKSTTMVKKWTMVMTLFKVSSDIMINF